MDRSFDTNNSKASIRGLIRDPFGKLIMAYTTKVHANHPLELELLALQRGIFHDTELDVPAIQIKGDCLAIITNI